MDNSLKQKYTDETGKLWFICHNITILMRKHYTFRMIGKSLYCSPIKPLTQLQRIEKMINKAFDEAEFKVNEMRTLLTEG